jgi:hypothetical protein
MAASGSALGRMGGHAVSGALLGRGAKTNRTPDRSDAARREAVLNAFTSVEGAFGWDEAERRWVAAAAVPVAAGAGGASGPSPRQAFFEHLRAHPITAEHDLDVFVRMLAAVIAMDGDIGEDEREVFASLVGPGHDLDALAARGSPGETLLLLAWAVALTDADLGEGELALLDWFGRALYLPEDRVAALRALAAAQVES